MKIRTVAAFGLAAAGLTWVVRAAWGLPSALGAGATAIQPIATGAIGYRDRRFHNTEPSSAIDPQDGGSLLVSAVTGRGAGRPRGRVPLVEPELPRDAAELAVTWYGHATALVEVDGYRVLADPVWSNRVSPSELVGPARLHPVPGPLDALPALDAVIISHDHYDHLDKPTVLGLVRTQVAPFVVPLGIGAHLRRWGVPEHRIVELDWGGSVTLPGAAGGLTLTCTEARHFSGRGLVRNTTLWASWSIVGPARRVYFGGDTGYTAAFAQAGAATGPFDLTLLPVGAYDVRWRDIHMNPEEAVQAHADLNRGDAGHGLLVPIHWATFNLAFHPWSEPVRRLIAAAEQAGTPIAIPRPGQRLDLASPAALGSWWENVDRSGTRPEEQR